MKHISFLGKVTDQPLARIGAIGCGSHSFRNLFPTFQFTPVDLAATCDLDGEKAAVYARAFGAHASYTDYREMIDKEELDGVVVCVNFDASGRPVYPRIAADCLARGVSVFIEKPPSATAREVESMMQAADDSGRIVVCGLKRMFFQMTTKARSLISDPAFGDPMTLLLQREERIPTMDELRVFWNGEFCRPATAFLDHFCHPASMMLYLAGMPQRMIYHRAAHGSGVVTFEYDDGKVASMAFTHGGSGVAGGVERLYVVGTQCQTVVIENCRVYCFQGPAPDGPREPYGAKPNYFTGGIGTTTALWEPEFQLGQLYSKGLFLLGYYDEILEFASAILEKRQPTRGTLLQCWQITHMFEKFAEGPGRMIALKKAP
ncbi:Gfo/Idh/MocA family oxidoreductase [bacterium]|nr:Gfo/Idh/MocA family oxidoreductase [bacterium]